MSINPSPAVRQTLYVVGVFLNAVVGSLIAAGVLLNVWVLAVMAGVNAVLGVMAASNVTTKIEE